MLLVYLHACLGSVMRRRENGMDKASQSKGARNGMEWMDGVYGYY